MQQQHPVQSYLTDLERGLRVAPEVRSDIVAELRSHLVDRSTELEQAGLPQEAAAHRALEEIGDPRALAQDFYASHSAGSWRDAALAAAPHLLIAALFFFHLWSHTPWTIAVVGVVALVGVAAWRLGRPLWAYPWVGYALAVPALTVAVGGAALAFAAWTFVGEGRAPLSLPIYLGISLWIPVSWALVIRLARRAAEHDWIVASLAALPMPVIATWVFLLHWRGGQLVPDAARGLRADSETGLAFVLLALTTALYVRMRRRTWRIAALVVGLPVLVSAMAAAYVAIPTYLGDAALNELVVSAIHTSGPERMMTPVVAMVLTVMFVVSPRLLDPVGGARWADRRVHPSGHV